MRHCDLDNIRRLFIISCSLITSLFRLLLLPSLFCLSGVRVGVIVILNIGSFIGNSTMLSDFLSGVCELSWRRIPVEEPDDTEDKSILAGDDLSISETVFKEAGRLIN